MRARADAEVLVGLRESELATNTSLTPPGTLPTLNVTPTIAGDTPTHGAAAQTAKP